MALGTTTVRRWAALLALAGVNDRPSHLLESGLLRARLCELVAARTDGAEPDRGFTVGLFSVVDSLLGMRMPDAARPSCRSTSAPRARSAGTRGRRAGCSRACSRTRPASSTSASRRASSLVDIAQGLRRGAGLDRRRAGPALILTEIFNGRHVSAAAQRQDR